jgi:hypothetical protein
MKMIATLRTTAALIAGLLATPLLAQTFSGTNAPGGATNFSFTITAASTNLSIIVPGTATAFSHLLLKQGSAPTDSSYDFISAFVGQTNALHLELPELAPGTWLQCDHADQRFRHAIAGATGFESDWQPIERLYFRQWPATF